MFQQKFLPYFMHIHIHIHYYTRLSWTFRVHYTSFIDWEVWDKESYLVNLDFYIFISKHIHNPLLTLNSVWYTVWFIFNCWYLAKSFHYINHAVYCNWYYYSNIEILFLSSMCFKLKYGANINDTFYFTSLYIWTYSNRTFGVF